MKLIVGLGNIGAHFNNTRHNVGFAVLDTWAHAHALEWQPKDKFKAIISEVVVNGQKIILIKPTTFYNLSGEAVRAIKDFYKIENPDILVVHDELALPFGTIRIRQDGSDAGNNGIKSIIAHVGPDVGRLRIGIASNDTPARDAADFVLSRFTPTETEQWPTIAQEASRQITAFADDALPFEHTSIRV